MADSSTPDPTLDELREAAARAVQEQGLYVAARDMWLSPSVLITLANGGRPLRDSIRRLTRWYHAQQLAEAEAAVEAAEE